MKKKTVVFIIIIILIPLILLGLFVLGLFKDKSDSKQAMGIIEKDYKVFEEKAIEFNDYRDNIYNTVFADSYYESFKDKYSSFNDMFKDYEKLTDEVIETSKNLIKYCNGIYYTSAVVNTMCSNFSGSYEVLVNSFVKDVGNYNILINEYNTYLKENNIDGDKLSKYKTNKKYIDYNKDKKFDGKE